MNTLITICARGGSKGIPGKNIRLLKGRPLLAYTIDIAKQFQKEYQSVDIVLSTDSEDIKKIAEQYGIKSDYQRPEYLANDTAGKIDAINDILLFTENKNNKKYDYLLDLDVTSPLRTLDDLKSAFSKLQNDETAINLFSVNHASRNPYFNMVEKKENGYYATIKKIETVILSRQASPEVYDMNASFYFYRRAFFDLNYSGAITDHSQIYLMSHVCFDLDHPIDFDFLEFLMIENKLNFTI